MTRDHDGAVVKIQGDEFKRWAGVGVDDDRFCGIVLAPPFRVVAELLRLTVVAGRAATGKSAGRRRRPAGAES